MNLSPECLALMNRDCFQIDPAGDPDGTSTSQESSLFVTRVDFCCKAWPHASHFWANSIPSDPGRITSTDFYPNFKPFSPFKKDLKLVQRPSYWEDLLAIFILYCNDKLTSIQCRDIKR